MTAWYVLLASRRKQGIAGLRILFGGRAAEENTHESGWCLDFFPLCVLCVLCGYLLLRF